MGNRRSHAKGGSSPLWHWTRESAPGSTAQAPQHTLCWQTPTLILDPELLQAVVVIRIDMPSMSYWEEVQTIFTPQPTPPPPGFVFACSSSQHSFTQCYSDFLFEPVIISAWAPPVSTIKSLMYMFILNLYVSHEFTSSWKLSFKNGQGCQILSLPEEKVAASLNFVSL